MSATIVDGKDLGKRIRADIKIETADLIAGGLTPGLAVVLLGDDPASSTYVRSKQRACKRAGIFSELRHMSSDTTQDELLAVVNELNSRNEIDGILVQTPIPAHIDEPIIMDNIDPAKDVDGFHPVNVGKLSIGLDDALVPATPLGVIEILKDNDIPIKGAKAVVIGRSDIVGKPVSLLLLHRHATVTICHSRTQDLPAVCREADILIAAVGRAAMVTEDYVKPGAVVIDVGINAVDDREKVKELFGDDEGRLADLAKKNYTIVGDVHPKVVEKAKLFTPVPGGVGPLTIACLLKNTLQAAKARRG